MVDDVDRSALACGEAMKPKLWQILAAFGAALVLLWGVVTALESYHKHQGSQNEVAAHQQDQEAQTHANAAQQIPDHAAELAAAQNDVDRAEVARLKRLLAAKPLVPLPATPGANPAVSQAVGSDNRDQVIAAQDVLIKAQDTQIKGLKIALADQTAKSDQWMNAYQDEHKAFMAQQAATNAWKDAVKESRWRGRIEGFAAGVAVGFAGGKL